MNWQEVVAHPGLRNLPFKIELNEWGQVVMSPFKMARSIAQGRIVRLLPDAGQCLLSCAIRTPKGVKVADIAYASEARWQLIKHEAAASVAPEICIEILSTINTTSEITAKRDLYFAAGAEEVWTCNKKGVMKFYTTKGEIKQSHLVPDFPRNSGF